MGRRGLYAIKWVSSDEEFRGDIEEMAKFDDGKTFSREREETVDGRLFE